MALVQRLWAKSLTPLRAEKKRAGLCRKECRSSPQDHGTLAESVLAPSTSLEREGSRKHGRWKRESFRARGRVQLVVSRVSDNVLLFSRYMLASGAVCISFRLVAFERRLWIEVVR